MSPGPAIARFLPRASPPPIVLADSGAGPAHQSPRANRPPLTTRYFEEDPTIKPNDLLYIGNRPRGDNRDAFHADIEQTFAALKRLENGESLDDLELEGYKELPLDLIDDPDLRKMIEEGLANGHFKDTTRIGEMIDSLNRFATFEDVGMDPLEFNISYADPYIFELWDMIAQKGLHPAGIVLSGSPKMLTKAIFNDLYTDKLIDLIEYCLAAKIPLFGICYGYQALIYGAYGVLPEYHRIPKGMYYKVMTRVERILRKTKSRRKRKSKKDYIERQVEHLLRVTPQKKQMHYGAAHVRSLDGVRDPLLQNALRLTGLELHSQGYPLSYTEGPDPKIPLEAVLAISTWTFRPKRNSPPEEEYLEKIIEVIKCGDVACGTQLHPELTPQLLLAFTYIKEDFLINVEGISIKHIKLIRKHLKDYIEREESSQGRQSAGYQFLFNWGKYPMLSDYLGRLQSGETDPHKLAHIEDRLSELYEKGRRL